MSSRGARGVCGELMDHPLLSGLHPIDNASLPEDMVEYKAALREFSTRCPHWKREPVEYNRYSTGKSGIASVE